MEVKKLISDSDLKEYAKFCENHTIIEGTYAQAFAKAKDKSLKRFI